MARLRSLLRTTMYTEKRPARVRSVLRTVMTRELVPPSLVRGGQYELLEAINRANATKLTLEEVTFSDPVKSNQQPYNTRVTLTARKTSGLGGQQTFQYRRFALEELIPESVIAGLSFTEGQTTHDLLPQLNEQLGARFTEQDFEDEALVVGQPVRLLAAPTSYYFVPSVDPDPTLFETVTQTRLSGFTQPLTTMQSVVTTTRLSGFTKEPTSLETMLSTTKLSGFNKNTT